MPNKEPHVWAQVDPSQPKEERRFWVFSDDRMIEESLASKCIYVGTCQVDVEAYHVFVERV